jgi:hypothetical protein
VLRWYRDRYGAATPKLERLFSRPSPFTEHDDQEATVTPTVEDDPYPRFWRWTGGNTHFYRVDSPTVVYFKFRATDNWVRAGSTHEVDCGPQHARPLERYWDDPDDPRDQLPKFARVAQRSRRFTRADVKIAASDVTDPDVEQLRARIREQIGHGTDDRSHDGPLYALLPADWPRVFEQLIRETDPDDHADWRDQLHEALLTTVDDWVDGLVLDNLDRARDAHERLRRATGAGPEEDSGG